MSNPAAALRRARSTILEYPSVLRLLAIAAFCNVAGLSFLWPINSIYIHDVLGKPLTVAGWVLLLNSAGAAVGNLAGGWLADRWGARPVMLVSALTSGALICLPGFFDSWPLYIAVMLLYGLTVGLFFPALNGLVARAWPEGGRRGFNFIYVAHNLGVAAGTAVGGVVAERSFQLTFLAAAAISILIGLFVIPRITGTEEGGPVSGAGHADASQPEFPVPWAPIVALFAAFILLWAVYVQWQTSIAVYMQSLGIELSRYGLLWTINGLVIFLSQPLVSWVVRRVTSFAGQLALGTGLYMAAFALLLTTNAYPVFVIGMIILTLGEVFLWPTVPAAIAQMSPPGRKSFLQGFAGSGATIGRMIGPLMGGFIYDRAPFRVLVLAMAILLAVPVLLVAVYARTRPRTAA